MTEGLRIAQIMAHGLTREEAHLALDLATRAAHAALASINITPAAPPDFWAMILSMSIDGLINSAIYTLIEVGAAIPEGSDDQDGGTVQ
jgi:hypothetical protein